MLTQLTNPWLQHFHGCIVANAQVQAPAGPEVQELLTYLLPTVECAGVSPAVVFEHPFSHVPCFLPPPRDHARDARRRQAVQDCALVLQKLMMLLSAGLYIIHARSRAPLAGGANDHQNPSAPRLAPQRRSEGASTVTQRAYDLHPS